MLPSWASERIVVTEPVWVDERGSKVATYPGPGAFVEGCDVQPGASANDQALRDNITIRKTVFLPPGTPITRHARVSHGGADYAIEGEPQVWQSPFGTVSHVMLLLIDWSG